MANKIAAKATKKAIVKEAEKVAEKAVVAEAGAKEAGVVKPSIGNGIVNGRPILLENGFYSADGMKISQGYYDRLWQQGRPAPFIQAREILNSNPKVIPDPRGAAGYFKYEAGGLEMIYNPTTGQIGHIQPVK